jgi:hypothetical protein
MAITLQAAKEILGELAQILAAGQGNDIASPEMHANLGLQSGHQFTYGELYAYVLYLIEALLKVEGAIKPEVPLTNEQQYENWNALSARTKRALIADAESHLNKSHSQQKKHPVHDAFDAAKNLYKTGSRSSL